MYSLDKRLSLVLATGYSIVWRTKIIDRWEELEAQKPIGGPQVPLTYLEALEAQIELVKKLESQGVQLETATKTIEKLTHVGKLYTATEIAKELGLRSAEQLNKELEEMNIQYKVNNTWVLRSWYADKGYTSIKQMVLENGKIVYDRKWTGTGREFLLGKFKETKLLPAGE